MNYMHGGVAEHGGIRGKSQSATWRLCAEAYKSPCGYSNLVVVNADGKDDNLWASSPNLLLEIVVGEG